MEEGHSPIHDWLSTLSALQRQQVDALLSRLRCVGSVALVHKLEWYRLLYRLRALMRDGLTSNGTTITAGDGRSSSQLFVQYLSALLPSESPQNVQEQLRKLHQLLRIADELESAAAEVGAAKAFFERLCAPLSAEELRRVQDCDLNSGPGPNGGSGAEEGASAAERPVLRSKRKRCDTSPHLTLKSFTQVASLLPRFQQWCDSKHEIDWEASLRIYLYTPTSEARARILRDMEGNIDRNEGASFLKRPLASSSSSASAPVFTSSPPSQSIVAAPTCAVPAATATKWAAAAAMSSVPPSSFYGNEVAEQQKQVPRELPRHTFWDHPFRAEDQRALASTKGWLTDECINILGGLFWRQAVQRAILEGRDAPSVVWMSSFFFAKLNAKAGGDSHHSELQRFFNNAVQEQSAFQQRVKCAITSPSCVSSKLPHSPPSPSHQLDDFAEVLIPIHFQGTHWLLAVYRSSEHTLTIYDSLCQLREEVYLPIVNAVGAFLAWQRDSSNSNSADSIPQLGGGHLSTASSSTSSLQLCVDVSFPQQSNLSDCGIYLLAAVEGLMNARSHTAAPAATPTIDLNPAGARNARKLWTAYLTQPLLHLSPLLHPEIRTDIATASITHSALTSPTPTDSVDMLSEEATRASTQSSAASADTHMPSSSSSTTSSFSSSSPLETAGFRGLSISDDGAIMTAEDVLHAEQHVDRTTTSAAPTTTPASSPFALHEAAECLWTVNATTPAVMKMAPAAAAAEALSRPFLADADAGRKIGTVSRTTRAHSTLLLEVLRVQSGGGGREEQESRHQVMMESSVSELEGEEEQEHEQEQEENEEKEAEEQQHEEATDEDDETGDDDNEEEAAPSPKRQRCRQAAALAPAGGVARRRASKPRAAAAPSGRSALATVDPALVPCIQLTTPIPLELLSQGLAVCMRSSVRKSEPAQAALFDALYGIRMELEDRISDGHKMAITYYKQAKRNEERQATALLARKLERPRAAQVLGALLEKWNETMDRAPPSVSPTR